LITGKQNDRVIRRVPGMLVMPGVILVLLLLLLTTSSFAQFKTYYEQAKDTSVVVKFVSSSDSSALICNSLIKQLADGLSKEYGNTSFHYSYRQVVRIISSEEHKYLATVDINQANCSGDVMFRNFDMSDVIFPNCMDIKATLLCKHRHFNYNLEYDRLPLNWGYNKIISFEFKDTVSLPEFIFTINSYRIFYDERARSAFERKIKLIDKYYESDKAITDGMKKLSKFDFSNIDMILVYDIMIKELEKKIDELFMHNFPGKLDLPANDPINFIDRFLAFSDSTRKVRAKEDDMLSRLDRLYYDLGMKSLAQSDMNKAEAFFRRSVVYNDKFVPSYLESARILYIRDSLVLAAGIIKNILITMTPDSTDKDSVLLLAHDIYKNFIHEGNEYLNQDKFNEALETFQNAIDFCTGNPGLACTDHVFKGLAIAKAGLYKTYVIVSIKATENKKYDLAQIYINEARKYQQANSYELNLVVGADSAASLLAHEFIFLADSLTSQEEYEQALEYYKKAATICNNVTSEVCTGILDHDLTKIYHLVYGKKLANVCETLRSGFPNNAEYLLNEARAYQAEHSKYITDVNSADSIMNAIKSAQYKNYISAGMSSITALDFSKALEDFDKAKYLSDHFTFRKDTRFDSLQKAAVRPIIYNDLFHATDMIRRDQLDSAENLCGVIRITLKTYSMEKDPSLDPQIRELTDKIHSIKCGRAKNSFNNAFAKAEQKAEEKDFLAATSFYLDAYRCADTNHDCDLDTVNAKTAIGKYARVTEYQRMLKKANDLLPGNDTTNYFSAYYNAEQYFRSNKISKYGLTHPDLFSTTLQSSNASFISYGVLFYLKMNEYSKCL
jgi:tetratricopeptide (TPR) repeat protein